jgi:hypothetical protein
MPGFSLIGLAEAAILPGGQAPNDLEDVRPCWVIYAPPAYYVQIERT